MSSVEYRNNHSSNNNVSCYREKETTSTELVIRAMSNIRNGAKLVYNSSRD